MSYAFKNDDSIALETHEVNIYRLCCIRMSLYIVYCIIELRLIKIPLNKIVMKCL